MSVQLELAERGRGVGSDAIEAGKFQTTPSARYRGPLIFRTTSHPVARSHIEVFPVRR